MFSSIWTPMFSSTLFRHWTSHPSLLRNCQKPGQIGKVSWEPFPALNQGQPLAYVFSTCKRRQWAQPMMLSHLHPGHATHGPHLWRRSNRCGPGELPETQTKFKIPTWVHLAHWVAFSQSPLHYKYSSSFFWRTETVWHSWQVLHVSLSGAWPPVHSPARWERTPPRAGRHRAMVPFYSKSQAVGHTEKRGPGQSCHHPSCTERYPCEEKLGTVTA